MFIVKIQTDEFEKNEATPVVLSGVGVGVVMILFKGCGQLFKFIINTMRTAWIEGEGG